jgi:hypothetical protein
MNPAPATPSLRLTRPGMYPVEYARWLLNPLRYLIMPPGRMADRLQLLPTDRVLEVGCGPGFFSPAVARRILRRSPHAFRCASANARNGVTQTELGELAALAGLTKRESWSGLFVNYNKPATRAA